MRSVRLFLCLGSNLILAVLARSASISFLSLLLILCNNVAAQPDIEKLIQQLGSRQFEDREKAMKELKEAGALAVNKLRNASKSSDPEIAKRAAECLPVAQRRATLAELIASVKNGNPKERCAGLDGLMGIARADRGGPNKRVNVIFGAEHLASLASDSVPVLLTSLSDENPDVRLAAINALWGFGTSAEKAVPKLVGILNDPKKEEFHRAASARALNEIGPAAEIAVPALVQLVKTERPGVLKNAAGTALGTLAKSDQEVVPLLLKGLNDESDVAFQSCAALSLGMLAAC